MRALTVTRESVELWSQGSTGDSRRDNPRRKLATSTSPEELARAIHLEFRRQLVRYLRKRVAQRKQAALKPSLVSRFSAWVKAKFEKPPTRPELVVSEDGSLKREAIRLGEQRRAAYQLGQRKSARSKRNSRVRKLLENPNLLRVVQTIVYEHDYFDRLMREAPGR